MWNNEVEALSKATRLGLKHPGADPYKAPPPSPVIGLRDELGRGYLIYHSSGCQYFDELKRLYYFLSDYVVVKISI